MRVSVRADYALRAALELAAASDSRATAEQLAHAQVIPDKFLETILTHLRRGNIVRGKRGPDGGFWLARPASEISLADVIMAVDGQLPSLRGGPPDNVTYPGPAEPMRRVWIALRAFGPTVLETVTLADIVSGELWLPGDPTRRAPRPGEQGARCRGNPPPFGGTDFAGRLLLNVVTGGDSAEQRRYGDHLGHDLGYERSEEFTAVLRGVSGAVSPWPPAPATAGRGSTGAAAVRHRTGTVPGCPATGCG